MISSYLTGSIAQMIERSRAMTANIPRNLPRTYDALAHTCRTNINTLIGQLKWLKEDSVFANSQNQPERVRKFKRIVSELDFLETVALVALKKAENEDHQLNALLDRACREVSYPSPIPVVTTLSQNYFHIYPDLRLLCVPLIEGSFLLHLPDLYHELAHPLLSEVNDPLVEPFQKQFASTLRECLVYVRTEQTKNDRRNAPAKNRFMLRAWESSWAKFWLTEFYCDLFAVLVVGPAFAWSHLHLAVKRGGDAYGLPEFSPTSHPADDARMRAMLYGLELIGFSQDGKNIRQAWTQINESLGTQPEPEYSWCYPNDLLKRIASDALAATRAINCQIVSTKGSSETVGGCLNLAWTKFWDDPALFPQWEKSEVKRLFELCLQKTAHGVTLT